MSFLPTKLLAVTAAFLVSCGSSSSPPDEDIPPSCEDMVSSGEVTCNSTSSPACDDGEPVCRCIDGHLSFDGGACEPIAPIYQACCACLADNQVNGSIFGEACLSSSVDQCSQALLQGGRVTTGLDCADQMCPGDCAKVACGIGACEGF